MPHGKILRIDPRGTNSANGRYGIPATNPFAGQAGTLGEIYALGMRDPHRFSWDTGGTHRMFLGHTATIPCGTDAGKAIVGGFVYRGSALPALRGRYIFGDLVDGRVFYTNEAEMVRGGELAPLHQLRILTAAGSQTSMAAPAGDSRVDMRLGVDRAGELYVSSKANGRVWKVTATDGSP